MNNVTSLDYANYNLTTDNDGVLGRHTQEYPRISLNYRSKRDYAAAPWGTKSTPKRFDCWQETLLSSVPHSCDAQTTLGGRTFKRGVWYYSGIKMCDHHDLSGFENPWATFETACDRETRPQLFINALNRLRSLDFSPELQDESSLAMCQGCELKRKATKEKSIITEEVS